MKIWLLLSRLGDGGLERVQINIAKVMRTRGVDVSLIAGQVAPAMRSELPATLPVIEIAKNGAPYFLLGLWRTYMRDRPDVVFTTSNDVACLVLALRFIVFRNVRVIVTQHLSLSGPRQRARGIKRAKLELIHMAMRALLPKADGVVAVSRGVAEDMRTELALHDADITVIHNPIITADFDDRAQEAVVWPWSDCNVPTIIFVGRLAPEKRLDLLLDSFHTLLLSTPARLLIVGTGPERPEIERRIDSKGLRSCCALVGFTSNVLPLMRVSDVLVLPSDYEGFGNVLVEAMACGTQVIATNCPHGPAEILGGGKYGQLVPMDDVNALESAIRNSLTGSFHIAPALLKERAGMFCASHAVDRYIALLQNKRAEQTNAQH